MNIKNFTGDFEFAGSSRGVLIQNDLAIKLCKYNEYLLESLYFENNPNPPSFPSDEDILHYIMEHETTVRNLPHFESTEVQQIRDSILQNIEFMDLVYHYNGIVQSLGELDFWLLAKTHIEEYVMPIIEYGVTENHLPYIIMPLGQNLEVEPIEDYEELSTDLWETICNSNIYVQALKRDFGEDNLVYYNGELRICDYGLNLTRSDITIY